MSESPVFRSSLRVAPEDIDDLGHASNQRYLHWIMEIAEAHSSAVGMDFAAYRELGAVFVVRRHEIDYLRSALDGDELLIETWVDSWKGASSVRRTTIRRRGDGAVLTEASTQWVFVSLERQRPRRIPEELMERFRAPLPAEVAS
jgi:acyl-CoA thioester hydrolase